MIIFRNVNFADLEALIDFMYQGEVNVVQEQLASFLTTAELLAVQGLTDGTGRDLTEGLEVSTVFKMLLSCVSNLLPFLILDFFCSLQEENLESIPVTETETPTEKKRPNSSSNSFYSPSTQNPVSPPTKRKKWSTHSVSSTSQKAKNDSTESKRQAQTTSDTGANSVEIIPVMSHVKLELPEFLDPDSGQVTYNNSGQEENPLESDMSGLDHNMPTASTSSKEESLDIYGGNSSDAGEISGEQMTPAELSK